MRTTDTHVYFWGEFLSNFYLTEIHSPYDCSIRNFIFDSSEQLFMFEKAIHFKDYESAYHIMMTSDPKTAKTIGRQVKDFDFDEWNHVSYDKMLMACRAKFSQNDDLKNKLLATGQRIIVEASPVDNIWGIGLHYSNDLVLDEKNWLGENRLGKVLMQVRDELS